MLVCPRTHAGSTRERARRQRRQRAPPRCRGARTRGCALRGCPPLHAPRARRRSLGIGKNSFLKLRQVGDDSELETRLSLALSSMARVGTVTDLTLPAAIGKQKQAANGAHKPLVSHVD